MRKRIRALIFIALSSSLPGQAQGNAREFEVASVKRSAPQAKPVTNFRGGPGTNDPERLTATNVTLRFLLEMAYRLRSEQILGPPWTDTDFYDVVANVPRGATRPDLLLMLQNLLTRRFQMVLRHETREYRIYELKTGRIAAKLTQSPPGPNVPTESVQIVNNRFQAVFKAYGMTPFARWLETQFREPVFDSTGLSGVYDFALEFSPEAAEGPGQPDRAELYLSSIQAAVEDQLRLRLQPARRSLDVLLIDHAEKIPTGN